MPDPRCSIPFSILLGPDKAPIPSLENLFQNMLKFIDLITFN